MTPRLALALALALAIPAAGPAAAQEAPADSSLPVPSGPALDPDQELSPAQKEALRARDEQELEAAAAAGDSYLPAAVGEATAPSPTDTAGAGAPAEEIPYGTPVDDLVIRSPSEVVEPAYGDYGAPAARPGQDLGDLLAVLIREWSREPEIRQLSYGAATAPPAPPEPAAGASTRPAPRAALRPGRALYAQTIFEVNSDYPGPVLVEILEEPLAGAVASGSFEVVRDRMVLRLSTLEHEGAVSGIDGWAVGLDCACFGIEGDVDRHWFERVILPAAISFAEAWTAALARPDTQVTVQGDVVVEEARQGASDDRIWEGVAAATGQVGRVLTEDAPRAMTVRIPRSTPLAVTLATPLITAAETSP